MAKVKVQIKCSQIVYYNQIIEMDKEDFEKLKDCDFCVSDNSEEYGIIEGYLDLMDVFDANNEFEDVEVNLYKEKKKRK